MVSCLKVHHAITGALGVTALLMAGPQMFAEGPVKSARWTLMSKSYPAEKKDQLADRVVMAYVAPPDAKGVALACSEASGLSAIFALKPFDFEKLAWPASERSLAVGLPGQLTIAGKPETGQTWFSIHKREGLVEIATPRIVLRILHAAWAGETVSIEIDEGADRSYSFPPVDDTLEDFVGACPYLKPTLNRRLRESLSIRDL
jgi:hypothetical protein